ncbi:sulfotransferase [Sphaerimonospora thailandensis]|uniref:Sulfotransferase n=1 Tax=Sphaerimonospora thailandensis TaxID=795644 RepID=A0A8J3W042_9ACTN|nr:sulfotransferase [Sphaerimonospora thailandensis]GIH71854.1 sulfotransferase [Sphaerimonospora thailandensis]
MAEADPVIFIGGLGRSGSMLLERLLGELPGVAPLGEVAHLWRHGVQAGEPCGCGQPFEHCPFWRKVGARGFGQWRESQIGWLRRLCVRVDRTRRIPAYALGFVSREAELVEYVRSYTRIYAAAAEIADAHTVVDSSRHASLAYCLSAIMDLRIVHLVRDPRAVAASRRGKARHRKPRLPEDGRPTTRPEARWTPVRTAVDWFVQNLAFEFLRGKGVDVVRVRYEDLLARPAETLDALTTRLGLPHATESFAFLGDRQARIGVAHTVAGNPLRFGVGRIGFRDRPVKLPATHRWLVTALTWPLLLLYGYRLGGLTPRRRATASRVRRPHIIDGASSSEPARVHVPHTDEVEDPPCHRHPGRPALRRISHHQR